MKYLTANQLAIILFNLPEAANGDVPPVVAGLEGIHAFTSAHSTIQTLTLHYAQLRLK